MSEETNDKKARGPLYDATRLVLMAAVGAASLAQDEVNGFVDRLVERGEMAEADARKLVREVLDRREKVDHERRLRGKKGAEPAATKADVEALGARISELMRQIEELKKKRKLPEVTLIKRYANRKLYDTAGGRYITLEEIAALVRAGADVRVVDHASGGDLTSLVLLQAFLSEEKRLGELLPRAVLTHLLRAGEERLDTLHERLLAAFDPERHLAEELRRRMGELVARGEIEAQEAGRLLERLLKREQPAPAQAPVATDSDVTLAALHRQLAELESQLAALRAQPETGPD